MIATLDKGQVTTRLADLRKIYKAYGRLINTVSINNFLPFALCPLPCGKAVCELPSAVSRPLEYLGAKVGGGWQNQVWAVV